MSDSSSENYPISDEPTRDLDAIEEGEGDLSFAAEFSERSGDPFPSQLGDYSIKKLLGSGGMGQVFLAEHTRMQRVVALKMLPVERMQDDEAVERFYEEVRAASRLMHPNIVTAFDAGEDNGYHYLAMEFVDGMTLTSVVSHRGPLSVGEAASVVRQAALGLLHAHRAGIVHRDVKPGNLMRAERWHRSRSLDLGLAPSSTAPTLEAGRGIRGRTACECFQTPRSEKPQTRRLIGTLAYMSPEQLEAPEKARSRAAISIRSARRCSFCCMPGRPIPASISIRSTAIVTAKCPT